MVLANSYVARSDAYLFLLTETYPPFQDSADAPGGDRRSRAARARRQPAGSGVPAQPALRGRHAAPGGVRRARVTRDRHPDVAPTPGRQGRSLTCPRRMRLRASGGLVCAMLAMIVGRLRRRSDHHSSTHDLASASASTAATTSSSSSSSSSLVRPHPRRPAARGAAQTAERPRVPEFATRNTTRVAGSDPIADAAGVALAVYPSVASGTHPRWSTIAPTDDWEAALASSVLMAPPIHAPVLLSGSGSLPADRPPMRSSAGADGVGQPVGRAGRARRRGAQAQRAARGGGPGPDPYTAAAQIDRFATAADGGHASPDVVIASTSDPAYAMPAAGWAAESGDPILFVSAKSIPKPTIQALQAHPKPKIYVLGPAERGLQHAAQAAAGSTAPSSGSSGHEPGVQLGRVRGLPRPAVQVRAGMRARPGELRLGAAQPRPRVHAAEPGPARSRPPPPPRSRAAATTVPSCWSTMPLLSPSRC